MKVVIAVNSDAGLEAQVSSHLRMCPFFAVAETDNGEIRSLEMISNPFSQAHAQPGKLPEYIKELGADMIISGGMGPKAVDFFQQLQIKAVSDASGTVAQILDQYLKKPLT